MFAPALAILLQTLPFTSGWELRGDAVRERVQEHDALRIDNGWAYRRDVRLQDGTIDFDAQLSRRRSFLYVCVRMQDDGEYEEFYLRAHKSELPDALQYAPVYQGQSAWQLHHGPGKTAAVRFDPGRWTHVRVVLAGPRMAVFLDDMTRPALLVPRAAREPRAGFIALRAFTPPDTPGDGPSARFANVRVTSGPPSIDIGSLEAPPPVEEPARVRAWMISGPLEWKAGDDAPVVPDVARTAEYRAVTAEPSGLIELHRHLTMKPKTRELTAAARFRVAADRAGMRVFDLGFSDRATVFVNGQAVFRGEASYSYPGRREGLIAFDQARLYLPLAAGTNEVLVMLSDSFGGMGLMGRFPDAAGLVVEAR